jgi:hypothetical protein
MHHQRRFTIHERRLVHAMLTVERDGVAADIARVEPRGYRASYAG